METHSSILAWKIHGQKSLAGCSLRGHKGSDVTEHSNKKGGSMVKNPPANEGDARDGGLIPGSGRPPGVSMATYASIFSGKFHGHRSLVGCSPWGSKELEMTEQLSTHRDKHNPSPPQHTHKDSWICSCSHYQIFSLAQDELFILSPKCRQFKTGHKNFKYCIFSNKLVSFRFPVKHTWQGLL